MENTRCPGCMSSEFQDSCPKCGWTAGRDNDPHQLPVGTLLQERYQVGRVLGQGGFGITYIGFDLQEETVVALKEFYPSTIVYRDETDRLTVKANSVKITASFEKSRERFLREARALETLRDIPEIVGILECFAANGTAYIVMEYVPGRELGDYVRLRGGSLSPEEALRILEPVIQVLAAVHRRGLVHRDISPDNIILHPMGGAKLLDFGAVRNIDHADADQDLTHSTEAIVKHGFAPMEQYRSRGSLGPWTDEYALCATIYYCLTGRVPPDALSLSTGEGEINWNLPGLTQSQIKALQRGMSHKARDRFPSLEELYQALYPEKKSPAPQQLPEDTPSVPPDSAPAGKKCRFRAGKQLFAIAAAALILAVAAICLFLVPSSPKKQPSPSADAEISTTLPVETEPTEPYEPQEETTAPTESWEGNILMASPFDGMGLDRSNITKIVFQDTTEQVPDWAEDVSHSGDGRVLRWLDDQTVYIAAQGGISAEECAPGLFYRCTSLTDIAFNDALYFDRTTSLSSMFEGCQRLEKLDLSGWNTSSVTDISDLFNFCTSLKQIDFTGWDTSGVQNLETCFYTCNALEQLDLRMWDTSSAVNMRGVFWGCEGLRELNLDGWDTSRAENMSAMFAVCPLLAPMDIDHWNVYSVTEYENFMYEGALLANGDPWIWLFEPPPPEPWEGNVLRKDPLDSFDLSRETITKVVFLDTTATAPEHYSDLSDSRDGSVIGWMDGGTVYIAAEGGINGKISCPWLFSGCENLTEVSFGTGFRTDYSTSFSNMFFGCTNLKKVDTQNLNTESVTNLSHAFFCCESLITVDVSSWDVSKVTNMAALFNGCKNLTSLNVAQWNTENVTNMGSAFGVCHNLSILDVSRWNTARVMDTSNMFSATALRQIDVSRWDTSNLVNASGMFANTYLPGAVNVSGWNTSKLSDVSFMFWGIGAQNVDLKNWDLSNIENYSNFMIDNGLVNGIPWADFFDKD